MVAFLFYFHDYMQKLPSNQPCTNALLFKSVTFENANKLLQRPMQE